MTTRTPYLGGFLRKEQFRNAIPSTISVLPDANVDSFKQRSELRLPAAAEIETLSSFGGTPGAARSQTTPRPLPHCRPGGVPILPEESNEHHSESDEYIKLPCIRQDSRLAFEPDPGGYHDYSLAEGPSLGFAHLHRFGSLSFNLYG
jgi:hypothetical protein